jgi:methylenetetrahydrofolate reductase (NADPH)
MRIDDIIANATEPTFSFEFSPPRTEEGELNLQAAIAGLAPLGPAFVSITYGAGGSTRQRTVELVKWMKSDLGLEAMAHLTCVGATVEDLRVVLDELRDGGIENVIALRGDFGVAAACYPEVHQEAADLATDLRNLKRKVDAGARFLITQLFFDNRAYFEFVAAARDIGIDVPIIPGIIPVTNVAQLKRMTTLCGASIPQPFLEALEARAEKPDAVLELGVAYATLQCAELLAGGAPGIHFYTINRSPATSAIVSALRLLRPWDRKMAIA